MEEPSDWNRPLGLRGGKLLLLMIIMVAMMMMIITTKHPKLLSLKDCIVG
jgi:hypothetical protein